MDIRSSILLWRFLDRVSSLQLISCLVEDTGGFTVDLLLARPSVVADVTCGESWRAGRWDFSVCRAVKPLIWITLVFFPMYNTPSIYLSDVLTKKIVSF